MNSGPGSSIQTRNGIIFWLLLAVGVGGGAALRPALQQAAAFQPAFVMTDQVQEEVNTSSFAQILGELRASTADLMWIKTERYLHRGVAYKPHLDADALAHTGEVVRQKAAAPAGQASGGAGHVHPAVEHGDEHDAAGEAHAGHEHEDEAAGEAQGEHHHHEALVALVPDAGHDYRGFIGTLQRAVQPWKGPGAPDEHTAGDELVPWYRVLTYSDPHHWRGYMIGAWWLTKIKNDPHALSEAGTFIEEGARNNPEVFQLQIMAGRVKIQQERWREALAAFERAAALALKVRPAGGRAREGVWSESDEEDFAAALRYIPSLQWRRLGDRAGARASVARGLKLLPQDAPLLTLQRQLAQAG